MNTTLIHLNRRPRALLSRPLLCSGGQFNSIRMILLLVAVVSMSCAARRPVQKLESGSFRGTQRTGSWKSWWADGTLRFEGDYQDGLPTGTWKMFRPDGTPYMTCNFGVGPRPVHYCRTQSAHFDGTTSLEYLFIAAATDALVQGTCRHSNGTPRARGLLNSGGQHGTWIYYDSDGAETGQLSWESGKRQHGPLVEHLGTDPDCLFEAHRTDFCMKEDIKYVIRRFAPEFKRCYQRALNVNPTTRGKVVLQFTVNEFGRAAGIATRSTDFESDAELVVCVERTFAQLQFLPPRGGKCAVVWPFVFSSQ